MGDCSDEIEDTLHVAQDRSAVGRRLHAGASVEAAIPPDADPLALLVEYSLNMLVGVSEALRTVAFEVDELAAEHHRLAASLELLTSEVAARRDQP